MELKALSQIKGNNKGIELRKLKKERKKWQYIKH